MLKWIIDWSRERQTLKSGHHPSTYCIYLWCWPWGNTCRCCLSSLLYTPIIAKSTEYDDGELVTNGEASKLCSSPTRTSISCSDFVLCWCPKLSVWLMLYLCARYGMHIILMRSSRIFFLLTQLMTSCMKDTFLPILETLLFPFFTQRH